MARVSASIMYSIMTIVFALAISQTSVTAQEPVYPDGNKIEGTWNIVITFTNCADGTPTGQTASGLNAFSQGGVMMEIPTGLAPANRYPGLGVWKHAEGRNYVGTFKAFRFISNTFAGKTIVVSNLTHELDDTLTAITTIRNYDANGNPLPTFCGTAVGTRFTGEN